MNKEDKDVSAGRNDGPSQPSGYQPTPAVTQPSRAPNPYSVGGYPGAAPQASGYPANGKSTADARKLVIGQGITMSGEIESCDHLLVEGTIEAALKGASVLDVAETGTFYGTVEIQEATIAGRFEGDIVVSGRLTVTSTGSVTGSVTYRELALEAGATLDGRVSPLTSAGASDATRRGTQASRQAKAAKGNQNEGANDGSELPLTGTAAE